LIAGIAACGLLVFGVAATGAYFAFFNGKKPAVVASTGSPTTDDQKDSNTDSNPTTESKSGSNTNTKTGSTADSKSGSGTSSKPAPGNDPKTTSTANPKKAAPVRPPVPKKPVPAGWVEMEDEDLQFRVCFPVRPSESLQGYFSSFLGEQLAEKQDFIVIVYTPPSDKPDGKLEMGVEIFKTIYELTAAKEISRVESKMGGVPAAEFVFEAVVPVGYDASLSKPGGKKLPPGNPGRFIARVMVTEKKIFIAASQSDTGMPSPEMLNNFFESFVLLN
jgi:hypothetical protein